jgi:cephalosporin-C deacetylase
MAFVDLPLEELKKYKPEMNMEDDFDIFWKEKIGILRSKPIEYDIEKLD